MTINDLKSKILILKGWDIGRTTITDIWNNRIHIEQLAQTQLSRKSSSKYSSIEKHIINFIYEAEENSLPINYDIIRTKIHQLLIS